MDTADLTPETTDEGLDVFEGHFVEPQADELATIAINRAVSF